MYLTLIGESQNVRGIDQNMEDPSITQMMRNPPNCLLSFSPYLLDSLFLQHGSIDEQLQWVESQAIPVSLSIQMMDL